MRDITRLFKALSDDTRIRILNILLQRECCVCEVVQALQISTTRASRNLNQLYDAGLLKMRRDGLWVLYSIDHENVDRKFPRLLDSIKKELSSNRIIKNDLQRLKTVSRIGAGCATQSLVKTPAN